MSLTVSHELSAKETFAKNEKFFPKFFDLCNAYEASKSPQDKCILSMFLRKNVDSMDLYGQIINAIAVNVYALSFELVKELGPELVKIIDARKALLAMMNA